MRNVLPPNCSVKSKSRDLYAVGRIRALEKELFDQGRFSRLAENNSTESFTADLSDTKYAPYLKEVGISRGLDEYFQDAYLFIRDNSSHPEIVELFHFRRDIMNYLNSVKEIEDQGAYSPGILKEGWWKMEKLPPIFREVESELKKSYPTPAEAPDNFIEKTAMDAALRNFSLKDSGKRIQKFYSDYIDIRNLLMNLFNPEAFYWTGGSISEKEWDDISISKEIPHKLASRSFIKFVSGHKDHFGWEVILSRWLSSRIRDMRLITFGPEPAAAYYLSLREEINNLRTLLTGILTGAAPDDIKERLNLEYL